MHCPSCGQDIGVWAIFQAGLPNRIRCPHCGARVQYQDARGVVASLVVLAIVFGYVAFTLAEVIIPNDLPTRIAVFTAILLAAWVPVELAAARFLRRRRSLRAIKPLQRTGLAPHR